MKIINPKARVKNWQSGKQNFFKARNRLSRIKFPQRLAASVRVKRSKWKIWQWTISINVFRITWLCFNNFHIFFQTFNIFLRIYFFQYNSFIIYNIFFTIYFFQRFNIFTILKLRFSIYSTNSLNVTFLMWPSIVKNSKGAW